MLLMIILSLDTVMQNFFQSQCCQWMFCQHWGSSYLARVPLRTDGSYDVLLSCCASSFCCFKGMYCLCSHVTGVVAVLTLENVSDVFDRHTRGTGNPITSAVTQKTGFSVKPLRRPQNLSSEVQDFSHTDCSG